MWLHVTPSPKNHVPWSSMEIFAIKIGLKVPEKLVLVLVKSCVYRFFFCDLTFLKLLK